MYGPPAYVWAMIIAGLTAIGATACITLYLTFGHLPALFALQAGSGPVGG